MAACLARCGGNALFMTVVSGVRETAWGREHALGFHQPAAALRAARHLQIERLTGALALVRIALGVSSSPFAKRSSAPGVVEGVVDDARARQRRRRLWAATALTVCTASAGALALPGLPENGPPALRM